MAKTRKNPRSQRPRNKQKKNRPLGSQESLTNPGMEGFNPEMPAQLKHLQSLYAQLKNEMDRRVRATELRARIDTAQLIQEHNTTRANQVVLQTILKDVGVLDADDFILRFERYLHNEVGVVVDGELPGYVHVQMYNFDTEHKPTTTVMEHTGEGPMIVIERGINEADTSGERISN